MSALLLALVVLAGGWFGSDATGVAPPAPALTDIQAVFRADGARTVVGPASLCGEPRGAAVDLACGGRARVPRARLLVEAGGEVRVSLGAPARGAWVRFERVLPGGRLERLTFDAPLRVSSGRLLAFTVPRPIPRGALVVLSVGYRGAIRLPAVPAGAGLVDRARAEFAVRLAGRR